MSGWRSNLGMKCCINHSLTLCFMLSPTAVLSTLVSFLPIILSLSLSLSFLFSVEIVLILFIDGEIPLAWADPWVLLRSSLMQGDILRNKRIKKSPSFFHSFHLPWVRTTTKTRGIYSPCTSPPFILFISHSHVVWISFTFFSNQQPWPLCYSI